MLHCSVILGRRYVKRVAGAVREMRSRSSPPPTRPHWRRGRSLTVSYGGTLFHAESIAVWPYGVKHGPDDRAAVTRRRTRPPLGGRSHQLRIRRPGLWPAKQAQAPAEKCGMTRVVRLIRTGFLGGSIPLKRGWNHGIRTAVEESLDASLHPLGEGAGHPAGAPAPQGARHRSGRSRPGGQPARLRGRIGSGPGSSRLTSTRA